jgi:prepilin-type N-terminal cleavage/methylation domain-containing protein
VQSHFRRYLSRTRCRGLSLTELMVATTLLAMATAGGLAGFGQAQAARRDAAHLQQLHERAQYVFASLEPELQLAGYFGHGGRSGHLLMDSIPEAARRCGADLIQHLNLPLETRQDWSFPCSANGGGAMPGSQVLILRRVSARTSYAPEAGRAQWLTSPTDIQGQLFWQGEAPSPGGVAGAELRELIVRLYYVAQAADGDATSPALRMKSLTSIAGVPAFIDTEVMPGVENLQVEVLPSPAEPRSLRVQLRIRGDAGGLRNAAAPQTLDVARHFTLRNAST